MMKPLVFTLVGQDKPGLVKSLASEIHRLGGNWLSSNFSHMAGHFAGFVEIDLPAEQHDTLIATFKAHPDLRIELVSADTRDDAYPLHAQIEITGNDRSGIVEEVTSVLNGFNINITKFESSCESAPNWGGQLFKAVAWVSVPDDFDLDSLHDELETLANDLVVDISRVEA